MINVNYKWHIYFLLLQKLEQRPAEESIDGYISHFRSMLLRIPSLNALSAYDCYEDIALDLLGGVAQVIESEQKIEFLGLSWEKHYAAAMNEVCPIIAQKLDGGEKWREMKLDITEDFKEKISFSHFNR